MSGPEPTREKGPGPTRYLGLGVQLAASILLFVFVGQWLDARLGTGGLLTILGAFLALGGTLWSLFRALKQDEKNSK